MRIHIVGGGPAGLYFASLMKLRDAAHEIRVVERNPPDSTFGWGVVFSDETLGNLLDADPIVYQSIVEQFAYWDAIDVRFRGVTTRSRGHGFCGLSRQRLLTSLQDRARTLGVVLEFEREVEDIDMLRDCDLLVGADGVRSRVRAADEAAFGPSLDLRSARYIWLGTEQSFEAFTFSFRETEHGVFQIHAYQFEPGTSTVIVECDEDTFQASGLGQASEAESIARCEEIFAENLDGHRLMGNRSGWIQFGTLRLERWHHGDVVLIGDAAHTAHFSVGSGTKLAMEDAIALSAALDAEPDRRRALDRYEAERRPLVGRTQKSAQQSLEWFENVRRYRSFEPTQLAFSLLTRSRRITHENLRLRDPGLVADADRWFLAQAGVEDEPSREAPRTPMFTPFTLRSLTLENRVVVSPMCQYSAVDGMPGDWHLAHLGARAVGGAGLVFTEMTDVTPDGRISPGCAGMWSEAYRDAWKRIVDFVHANSRAKLGIQLGHAGRKGSTDVPWRGGDRALAEGGWEVIAPSPLPYRPGMATPRAMTRDDMDHVTAAYVHATRLSHQAGFDLIELHAAHGYLLSSFLTPLSNHRDDEYGGSLENRMRYPLEVFEAIRAAWPDDKPISVRLSATDWVEGGLVGDDAVVIARAFKERGCDIIDVSTGQTSPDAQPIYGRCYQTPFADQIRNEAGIPTIAVGAITTADQVNTILLAGRADLCALAREHLRDPAFTLRAAAELGEDDVFYPNPYRLAKPRSR